MKLTLPQSRKGRLLVAAAVVAALALFTFLMPKLSGTVEGVIESVAKSLGKWAYLLVALLAMAETAAALGFVAPGEIAVIIGGVLAGEGTLSIALLIGIVWASVVIGDSIGFLIGRRLGRSFIDRHSARFPTMRRHFDQVEDFFRDHGGKSVFLGRWIGFVRPLMPFTAGTSGMRYRAFLPYDVISGGIWGTSFCLLGYVFWRNFGDLSKYAGRGALALGLVIVALVLGVRFARGLRDPQRRRRYARWIERQADRPLLRPPAAAVRFAWRTLVRPVWLVARPWLRFVVARLTPGELGIELTTLIAIAGVCVYVIFLQIQLLDTHTLIFGDQIALDISREIQNAFLTAVARSFSLIGNFAVVLLFVVGTVGYLLGARRRVEATTLVAAFLATDVGVWVMKATVQRPRPADEIVDASGYSYPSGHAALAIVYAAVAVLIARTTQRAHMRVVLVVAGIVGAALIGLSRVYLRVHYLSDTIGGWALGLAIFSLLGSVALVVDYILRAAPEERPIREKGNVLGGADAGGRDR
jgi:membrane protein DedA with SNARE-associated domain